MISFERSEKEIKERKSHVLPSRQRQQNHFLFRNQKFRINSNAQKGKLNFVRTLVRVLRQLIVRYTSPMPQIFSESINTIRVGGLFGVWMRQRIKHTTEGVKTQIEVKCALLFHKTNVKIIIMLLYSHLFGAWKLKSQNHNI